MSFLLASAARATTGARSGQEDAFRLWPAEGAARPEGEDGGLLAVLADGMGGHTGGAVAGQTACSTFAEEFAAAATPYEERLQSALHASNEALAKGVEQNSALRGMGCTLVAAWIDTLGVRWASVGDSLLLLYRFPDVIRLNADHSLGFFLDEQARQNRISASEAKQHHNRNALRSALTGSKIDLIDLRSEPLELRPGDWILLASDGICSLEGDEIADVVYNYRQSTPEEMADGLIAAVVKKAVAGQDNTTVVAVRVDQAPEADVPTRRVAVRKRGDEETELRSRRIGVTGRKSVPGRRTRTSTRSAVWLVAAAVFFLFFAVTVLLRALQPAAPPTPTPAAEAARPEPIVPAAVTAPEPATPDTPEPTIPDTARPPAPSTPQPDGATAPDAASPRTVPVPPKAAPPTPQRAAPSPAPSRPQPAQPPVVPVEPQPAAPPPNTQSGTQPSEAQEVLPWRAEKHRERIEKEKRRREERERRREERAKEALKSKSVPKSAPKSVAKDVPKEVPKSEPREPPRDVLPQGFGSD